MESNNYLLSWKKKILFCSILVLLVTVFCMLSAEIILRLIYHEETINGSYWGRGAFEFLELTGYRHTPGFKGRAYRRGVFDSYVEISEIGLRQKNFELQKLFLTRVLILGDSFTFGLGIREESTFASLIQESLNPVGTGVINGGQAGYSIAQEVKWGILLAQKISPQIIILFAFLFNDIKDDYHQGYKNVEVKYGYRLHNGRSLPGPVFDFLRTHSYLWMFIRGNVINKWFKNSRGIEFEKLAENETEKVMQPTFEALKTLKKYCMDKGIRLGIVLIPPSQGRTIFDVPFKYYLEVERISFLDLGNKGFTEHDYFQGDGHWNENGHRKAAKYLVPFVRYLSN